MRRVGKPKAFKAYSNSEIPGCFIIVSWREVGRRGGAWKKNIVKRGGILLPFVFEDSKGELSL